METTHHQSAIDRAMSAIKEGRVDHGEWIAPDQDERKQSECVGAGMKYPVFSGGKVSAKGVASALGYARTNDPSLVPHLEKMDEAIKAKAEMKMGDAEPIDGLILEGGEFGNALAFSAVKMPPKRNGLPCHYFYKESLIPGTFKDSNGRQWTITPKDIADAKSDLDRALLLGHEPPIQDSHKSPGKSFGFVKGARINERGGLELLHQFMGDSERDEALRRKTSIMLLPKHEDAKGNKFSWYTDHSAVVFRPQLTDLKDYTPALAASGQQVNAVYLSLADGDIPMDLSILTTAIGEPAKGKTDTEVLALAASTIQSVPKLSDVTIPQLRECLGDSAKNATDAQIPTLALSALYEANQVLASELSQAERERDEAKSTALTLSATTDEEEMTPQVLALSAKAYGAEITTSELERQAGKPGINAEQAAWLRDAIKQNGPLMLSADATTGFTDVDRFIAFAKLGHHAIDPNKPIPRGVVKVKPIPAPPGTALALEGKEDQTDNRPLKERDPGRYAELMTNAEGH